MSSEQYLAAEAAFSKATSMADYEAAKRLAAKCEVSDQMELVDLIIDTKQRIKHDERSEH